MVEVSVPGAPPTALCRGGEGQNRDVVAEEIVGNDGAVGGGAVGGAGVAVHGSNEGLGLAVLDRLVLLIGAGGSLCRIAVVVVVVVVIGIV